MKKECVFCGSFARAKNREHVIPQWLIRITGMANQRVRFGYDKATGIPREFNYNSFAFPACEDCNSKFSKLEALAKPVITKVLSSEALSKHEFHTLLDWFDKVRIGLWLAFYYLDKNFFGITPKFHIATRIGLSDRMLQIVKVSTDQNELSFRGCDMPSFYYTPSCFSMIINGYCFINMSVPFLVAPRLGFPFSTINRLREDGLIDIELHAGDNCAKCPVMPDWLFFEGTSLFQAMFPWQIKNLYSRPYYENEYVRAHSLSFEEGVGEVFIEREGKLKVASSTPTTEWVPVIAYDRAKMNPDISIHTLRLQSSVDRLAPLPFNLSETEQKWWQETYRANSEYADKIIAMLERNAKTPFP